jgi:predicted RNase H-like HicB family nuclease
MKSKYEIIIYWSSDDNCFVAEVPELPGCMADGKDYSDVIKNVLVVIDEWIDTAKLAGRKIPDPQGRLMFA